ncbi:MAG: tRNA (adenosine(37)-N6)-threonylcarbamoyltransferase complex ATPase subunit type 1 TsaE [Myxococcales bacterium]|jgi:tRNA threonylcarbamoyladenosine biosynthesis protein TsaE
MLELELESEASTLRLARLVAAELRAGDVVGLEGDLGAGKTTFARGVVHGMGVSEDVAVTSPTFALLHQYRGRLPIVHADLYRLGDEAELQELGIDELVQDGAVLLVEWGRRFEEIAQRAVLWIELDMASDDARRVRLQSQGGRGDAIISALSERLGV